MNLQRILAILKQEYYMTYRSTEVIFDIVIFPLINIIIFGFILSYLNMDSNKSAGEYFLLGMMLWQFIWIIEYSVSVGSLWNIWSRNLSNIFISPITVNEYIFAHTLSGIFKAIVLMCASIILVKYAFGFNLMDVGLLPLILVFINFAFFAFSFGISILGLIFRYGNRIQAFAWGLISLFQPITGAFFPVKYLPLPLQYLAYIFPPTYSFEAARLALTHHIVDLRLFGISFLINIIYFVFAISFFSIMFKKSLDSGQFARNES